MSEVHKVVIIGSGPAGWTAALYTARANLKPLVFEGGPPNTPGGQLMITSDVENYPGFPDGVLGPELMDRFKAQAVKFECEVRSQNIARVDFSSRPHKLWTDEGDEIHAHTVIISTGANAKLLHMDKEAALMGSGGGVSACATCDGAFFKNVHVAVVGGGDSAMEEANFLTRFASKVTLIHRRDTFRASKIMVDRAKANPKISWEIPYAPKEILTKKEEGPLAREIIRGIVLENTEDGSTKEIEVEGFFIAIGHKPNTDLFRDWLDLDDQGYLVLPTRKTQTKIAGVFACGDVADSFYRQAITAAGTGCQAAIEAERFLEHEGL